MDLSTSLASATLPLLPATSNNDLSFDPAQRNNVRLQAKLAMNTTIIGMSISFTTNQHLPSSRPTRPLHLHNVDDILPPVFATNYPGRHYPNNFIAKVKLSSNRTSKTPLKSSLRFNLSREAAEHNAKQLAYHDFDVSRLISDNQNSIISYRSEFREPPLLHLLLRDHPLWGFLRKTLERGEEFGFTSEQSDEA
jgi:hypothetical protein